MTTQFARMLALALDIRPEEQLLDADICTIGRAPTCQITVSRNIVSRVHARIERDGLRYLLHDAGNLCTRESCAAAIWGRDYDPGMDAAALDRAIANLRRLLRQIDPSSDAFQTQRGLGYLLKL